MNGRPDNERLKIFGKFLRAHQQVAEALNKDLMDERGLALSWYDVLLQLSSTPEGRLRLQDLAERVLYSRSGLTRLIDRMEAAGLVKRQPCSQDKRGTYAALTPEGRRAFRRAASTHLRGIEEHFFAHLSEEQIAAVRRAMDSVLLGMRRSNGRAAVPAAQ
jgi:DNA-binding MarR family transcriptional regulator